MITVAEDVRNLQGTDLLKELIPLIDDNTEIQVDLIDAFEEVENIYDMIEKINNYNAKIKNKSKMYRLVLIQINFTQAICTVNKWEKALSEYTNRPEVNIDEVNKLSEYFNKANQYRIDDMKNQLSKKNCFVKNNLKCPDVLEYDSEKNEFKFKDNYNINDLYKRNADAGKGVSTIDQNHSKLQNQS